MKIAGIRFDSTGSGGTLAIGAPPSGAGESHLWRLPGNVVRSAAGFPRSSIPNGGAVRVTVELESNPSPSTPIAVRATPHGTNMLGAIPETSVNPGRWHNNRCELSVDLDASALRAGGVGDHHAAWHWEWRRDGQPRVQSLGLSEHLLFVTIGPPTAPWSGGSTTSGSLTLPWLGALTQACRWGRGAKTRRKAASHIVQALFALGGAPQGPCLRYAGDRTTYLDPGMAEPHWFDCERFLADLDAGGCAGLNCFETATLVVTFANLLGCALVPCAIEGDCIDPYDLNPVQSLGLSSSDSPDRFRFHVVALEQVGTAGRADDRLYDASLMVDEDTKPANAPRHFVLPDGMRLGARTSPAGAGKYLPQLVAAGSIQACRTRTVEPAWVGAKPAQDQVGACPLERHARYLSELQHSIPTLVPVTAGWMPAIDGYRGRVIFERRPGVPRINLPRQPAATRMLFASNVPESGQAIRVDWWVDEDPSVTLSFMAELLAMIELPVDRVSLRGLMMYTVPHQSSVLVLERGIAARYASVGRVPLDMVRVYASGVRS